MFVPFTDSTQDQGEDEVVATYTPATWNKPLGQVPREERSEVLEATINATIGELEADLEAGHTERFLEVLRFYAHFRKYSFGNILLILEQLPTATRVAGFRTWERLGYHVRKGEKALFIRGPVLKKELDLETGEIIERLVSYIALPVFDVSQLTEVPEFPDFTAPLAGDFDQLYFDAKLKLGCEGILVTEDKMPREIHGSSWGGRICINQDLSTSEKLLCLYHELAHEVSDHRERDDVPKMVRELEAEAVAWLICKLQGLEHPYSRDYLTAYRATVPDLRASMQRIQAFVSECCRILDITLKEREERHASA